jgi:hypothetical protein
MGVSVNDMDVKLKRACDVRKPLEKQLKNYSCNKRRTDHIRHHLIQPRNHNRRT